MEKNNKLGFYKSQKILRKFLKIEWRNTSMSQSCNYYWIDYLKNKNYPSRTEKLKLKYFTGFGAVLKYSKKIIQNKNYQKTSNFNDEIQFGVTNLKLYLSRVKSLPNRIRLLTEFEISQKI